jgi:hypothetical protein
MAHVPGSLVRPAPDDSLDLQGANAFLALKHQVDDLKPCLERIVRIFKNRLGKDRETITVPSATCCSLADPVKRAGLQCIPFVIVAAKTLHTVRLASFLQKFFARFSGAEAVHGF